MDKPSLAYRSVIRRQNMVYGAQPGLWLRIDFVAITKSNELATTSVAQLTAAARSGATENVGVEISTRSKMQGWKM